MRSRLLAARSQGRPLRHGGIGQEIAKRLEPFKVEIGYHTRSKRDELSYTYYASLKEMASAVDILICIVPGTPEPTRPSMARSSPHLARMAFSSMSAVARAWMRMPDQGA